jgi:hypothetical protein
MQEETNAGQSVPTPKKSDDQIRSENEKVLQGLMQEKSNTGQSAPTPKKSDDQIRSENEHTQSKALAEANSAGPEVKTYYSPDREFSIQESQDQVEFVNKAAGRRTTIGLIGHMMGKPVFSKDNSGFVVPGGLRAWEFGRNFISETTRAVSLRSVPLSIRTTGLI